MKRSLISIAALALSAASAFAADLGGNCCADLEERVAELEATTARKGNRRVSLEVWGQVNKAIVAWSDGSNHNINLGSDNTNASTRFGLRGQGKVSADMTAGYSIVIEAASGARTATLSQLADKTSSIGAFGVNDNAVTMREANWWIEHGTLGRVTLGRFVNPASPQGAIDFGGISNVAGSSMALIGGGLFWNTGIGLVPVTLASTTDAGAQYATRENGIAWTSPSLAGFTVALSAGGALSDNAAFGYGAQYGAAIKYAGEFADRTFRIAAAAGYERSKVENNTSMITALGGDSINTGYSLSLMHVTTGMFVQSFYNTYQRGDTISATNTARQWMAQAGVSKNWFGVGNTAPYVEYGKVENGLNTFNYVPSGSGANSTVTMLGLGVTQNIDAASMQLYAGYRDFKPTSDACGLVGGCKTIGIFTAGAQIKF